jgi:hypothetical protein
MKTHMYSALVTVALLATLHRAAAQGTAFTYQGRLTIGTNLANGNYDLKFSLYDVAASGNEVAGPVTNAAVAVSNGLFTAALDFGAGAFTGADRWLEISARTNGSGGFTTLNPRQPLTPTPYALWASSLSSNANQTFAGTVSFSPASGPPFAVGSALKVVNLNADLLDGFDSTAFWKLSGNAATTAGTHFVGTTDSQDLWLKVNNQVGWRLLRSGRSSSEPNLAGGGLGNQVYSDAKGCGIAAGNSNAVPNDVYYGSIGGGWNNRIIYLSPYGYGDYGVIGGGQFNTSAGHDSVTGGGDHNTNYGACATISGGATNYVTSSFGAIGGGVANSISAQYGTISGGSSNAASASYATIAGGLANKIQDNEYGSAYATIGGGAGNTAFSDYATIAGGQSNSCDSINAWGTIGGGVQNRNVGTYGTIGGGKGNAIREDLAPSHPGATIAGGESNVVNSAYGSIGGGQSNFVGSASGTIGGGALNTNAGLYGTVGGGLQNYANSNYSTVGGGSGNAVHGSYGTIPGGLGNTVAISDTWGPPLIATIGGGSSNSVSAKYSTIGGGNANRIDAGVRGTESAAIGGGASNDIRQSLYATIAGGLHNSMSFATGGAIGGGQSNVVYYVANATIGGGAGNSNSVIGGTIGGGENNWMNGAPESINCAYATIGGGSGNSIGVGNGATIGGGISNSVGKNVPNSLATIAGGYGNRVEESTSDATIGGGAGNSVAASYGTVPGGAQSVARNYGQMAYASGQFATNGDAQTSMFVCRGTSTSTAATELFLDGAAQRMVMPTNSTWGFDLLVSGRAANGSSGVYHIRGAIKNTSGTTSLVGSILKDSFENVSGWDATVGADDTHKALVVQVTGAASTTIRWVASVRTVEVIY